ncbi:Ppx-GppA phosphatase protein (Exopolyphosphatase) [Melia azedarach]|uniref:Ppx-GppA phosphatase protein (Exopolyphosphatase) n=1 Tax=Melia azedarach TaxID=155640 RepID=A0ACC1Y6L8_MELAZ|nr:Ppx-GppA phosphatase protein (Exopolyphosphatase) [Melia azedarach]
MATNIPSPQTPQTLFASIDMGTNSFKLLIIRAYPNGKFFTVDRLKESVVLGRDLSSSSLISVQSQSRSFESLRAFKDVIQSHNIKKDHTLAVATAAVRRAENKKEFIEGVKEKIGFDVDVLSGEEEARFVYLGVLQFLPVYDKLVLCVDIGGGSTEFVIGKKGKIVFCDSLNLGHVSLSEKFATCSGSKDGSLGMRECIRLVIRESGLIERVKEFGFEVAVGCSGTIRAIEKAVFNGYYQDFVDNVGVFGDCKRDWRLSRGELRSVVERLCSGGGEGEKVRKEMFFKRRSEFIVAGAVLLEEIFELLGIEEMDISGYGLGEGVIADSLAKVFGGYDWNANARWRSVVRLATRFNNKKRIKAAAECASIAKDIFEDLRKCDDLDNNQVTLIASLDDKDLEYLEAACLLHDIGLFTSKKGYHKQSYHIITNGDHLYGYSTEEIKLIALLTRFHRKKFPKFNHALLEEFPEQAKQKFRLLCIIIRLSVTLQQNESVNLQEMKFSHSHEGFKLVINKATDQTYLPVRAQSKKEEIETELGKELEYFKMVFKQELLIVVPSSSSNDMKEQFTCEKDVDHVQI